MAELVLPASSLSQHSNALVPPFPSPFSMLLSLPLTWEKAPGLPVPSVRGWRSLGGLSCVHER